jgi:predicted kinase
MNASHFLTTLVAVGSLSFSFAPRIAVADPLIPFNPGLRYIDVISEVAFLGMDLIARDLEPLAWRFLNRYLEHTGDYAGLAALPFYLVYRALVRAKVAAIRASQGDADGAAEMRRYLDLAERLTRPGRPALLLMHGCSGSGKTWLSQRLLERLGAIRLRSDVERKRLFNLHALADSRTAGDIYTPEAGRLTFAHLSELAGRLLDQGFPVIVDATFLKRGHRADFTTLADGKKAPWRILSSAVAADTLRRRVAERMVRGDDASEADLVVLENQLANAEPLDAAEEAHQIVFGDDWDTAIAGLGRWLAIASVASPATEGSPGGREG